MKKYILLLSVWMVGFAALAQNIQGNPNTSKTVEQKLKVYPNPCKNNKVTIEFDKEEISEIKLSNITGKQVLLKEYTFPVQKVQLHLFDIPNGIYLVQVKTAANRMVVKKLMVSNH